MPRRVQANATQLMQPMLIDRAYLNELISSMDPQGNFFFDVADDSDVMEQSRCSIVPVRYTLFHRLDYTSGGYWSIRDKFDAAMNSTSEAVILDIDSPGGDVAGLFELVEHMRSVRSQINKPVVAVANESAYSAAYAIATVADRVVLNSITAGVGSVGAICLHMDRSKMERDHGVKFTSIYSGDRKNDFSPHEPLSDTAKQIMKDRVDTIRELFVASVDVGRPNMSASDVFDTEAGSFHGEDALAVGFADEVVSLEDLIDGFNKTQVQVPGSTGGGQMADHNGNGSTPEATPTPAPAATVPAQPAGNDNVVQLDAARNEGVQAGVDAERQRVAAINELCSLAGQVDMAGTLIANGSTEQAARKALVDARSNDDGVVVSGQRSNDPEVDPAARERVLDPAAIYRARGEQTRVMAAGAGAHINGMKG